MSVPDGLPHTGALCNLRSMLPPFRLRPDFPAAWLHTACGRQCAGLLRPPKTAGCAFRLQKTSRTLPREHELKRTSDTCRLRQTSLIPFSPLAYICILRPPAVEISRRRRIYMLFPQSQTGVSRKSCPISMSGVLRSCRLRMRCDIPSARI